MILREFHSIRKLTQLFNLPKSTFYNGIQRTSTRVDKDASLRMQIKTLFNGSRSSAGQRTLIALLKKQNIHVSRHRVRKIMYEEHLHCKQRRRRPYRRAEKPSVYAPNRLNRQFSPAAINRVWCGDVTYIWTQEGWCYLAAVMDLACRKIVGFAVSDKPDTHLTKKALLMAFESRGQPQNVLFHSDQGCHYSSDAFRILLQHYGMTHSMSRKGNCWDNASMERFFGALKSEWVPKLGYASFAEADRDLHHYIHGYYNSYRPHTHNQGLAPNDAENALVSIQTHGLIMANV